MNVAVAYFAVYRWHRVLMDEVQQVGSGRAAYVHNVKSGPILTSCT